MTVEDSRSGERPQDGDEARRCLGPASQQSRIIGDSVAVSRAHDECRLAVVPTITRRDLELRREVARSDYLPPRGRIAQ